MTSEDVIVETPLEPYENLRFSGLFTTQERKLYTPSVLVGYNPNTGRFTGIRGNRIDVEQTEASGELVADPIECNPKSFSDIADFLINAGTVFACFGNKNVLQSLYNYLPYDHRVELARTGRTRADNTQVTLTNGKLTVRRGNRWGRAFTFWDALPKWCVEKLDENDPSPMSLDDFSKVFDIMWKDMKSEGFSIATLNSPASVLSNFLLNTRARIMFGHHDIIPPYVTEWAHQAYKGAVFESTVNSNGSYKYIDLVASHPSEAANLVPCHPPYMTWHATNEYTKESLTKTLMNEAFYAFIRCLIVPTESYKWAVSNIRYCSPTGYRLGGLFGAQIATITLPEYKALVSNELARVDVLDGCLGIVNGTPKYKMRGPMEKLLRLRNHPNLGRLCKSQSQAVSGKMGSTYLERVEVIEDGLPYDEYVTGASPIFQIIYSSHINGSQRAKINTLAILLDAQYKRADGLIVPLGTKIPSQFDHNGLGGIVEKAKGRMLNPDDVLWEGPEDSDLLGSILSMNKDGTKFTYTTTIVTSFRGELLSSNGRMIAGIVKQAHDMRRLGSHKRLLTTPNTRASLEGEGIRSVPAKGLAGLDALRRIGGTYDYA